MNDIVEQLERYHSLMRPSGLGGGGLALSPDRAGMLKDAAAEIRRLRSERDQYLNSSVEYGNLSERLRAALQRVVMHELRDHDDYTAIQDIAEVALRTLGQCGPVSAID